MKKIALAAETLAYVRTELGARAPNSSDVEAILVRAKERTVLALRDTEVQLAGLRNAVDAFIDPLDANLLALRELAAVLACSDRRFLPEKYRHVARRSHVSCAASGHRDFASANRLRVFRRFLFCAG